MPPDACPPVAGRSVRVARTPEGWDAAVLADLAAERSRLLHVCRDDSRLDILARCLGFFAPDLKLIRFPAWDCLPYDRVSPNTEIVSQRLATMAALADAPDNARFILLTTVNAVLQRLPARRFLESRTLTLQLGASHPPDQLLSFLEGNGYLRTGTVREAGEYAVRGGIIDLFSPGRRSPLRLDFFGDEIEGMRSFDAATQRTIRKVRRAQLLPVAELVLDEDAVGRFRRGYRVRFGADIANDPLYAAVGEGRRHAGVEHWLPLFHETLETIFDHVGPAAVSFDHQADGAVGDRFEMITECFESRRVFFERGVADAASIYRPLPQDALYLDDAEWESLIAARETFRILPFNLPDFESVPDTVMDVGAVGGVDFSDAHIRSDVNIFDAVKTAIMEAHGAGDRVVVSGFTNGSRDRLAGLLTDHGIGPVAIADSFAAAAALSGLTVAMVTLPIDRGFRAGGTLFLAEPEILGERLARPSRRRRRGEEFLHEVSSLSEGDFVVHVEHGIGRYDGLETLDIAAAPHDCLRLSYAGGDKLYVPVENIDVLSRYGPEEVNAIPDKLGGVAWQARKARVKKRLRAMADQLIRIAAERELRTVEPVEPPPSLYDEFCARFPYNETEDQGRAILDTLEDIARGRPMDRLICGDVGFGKTEVALRAAMIVAMQGFQVAVVTPTTLLCRQHYQVFRERFAGLPLRIDQLSRLVDHARVKEIRHALKTGDCNILIGTHAALSKTISFDNLGLVVIDEEQHFGVAQKERLKELRTEVHILTLTATPIPRTLQLALSGVRDLSLIATPPVDRLSVRTFVMPYDGMVIREAIERERNRGGQTFYVCPRIDDMPRVYDQLRTLVPNARIGTAHGRMPSRALEEVMTLFCDGEFDILLGTNIIESGLDIPNANTIVIHRADMFGLAQLYQLRGRVGRSKIRAYAYLTTQPGKVLKPTAQRRLQVMHTLDSLGAGFSLASHDMDIRGAGNLLGEEQSGQVKEVGIELYQHLLQEAVRTAKDDPETMPEEEWTPQISPGTPVLIPDTYVSDLTLRLGLYRRIARLADRAEIDAFGAELTDRFGSVPVEVDNLLKVIAIKQLCRLAGVEKIDAGPRGAVLSFRNAEFANLAGLVAFLGRQGDSVKLRADHKLVCRYAWGRPDARLSGLTRLMRDLAAVASE